MLSPVHASADQSPDWLRRFVRGAGLGLVGSICISAVTSVGLAYGQVELTLLAVMKYAVGSIIDWAQLLVPLAGLMNVLATRRTHTRMPVPATASQAAALAREQAAAEAWHKSPAARHGAAQSPPARHAA